MHVHTYIDQPERSHTHYHLSNKLSIILVHHSYSYVCSLSFSCFFTSWTLLQFFIILAGTGILAVVGIMFLSSAQSHKRCTGQGNYFNILHSILRIWIWIQCDGETSCKSIRTNHLVKMELILQFTWPHWLARIGIAKWISSIWWLGLHLHIVCKAYKMIFTKCLPWRIFVSYCHATTT